MLDGTAPAGLLKCLFRRRDRSFIMAAAIPRIRVICRAAIVLIAPLLATSTWLVSAWPAAADPGDESQYEDFYTPPSPLPPGQAGDPIRTEPSRLVLEPSGQLGAFQASGTRVMYRSEGGGPTAVTGTYFEPTVPWPGSGPRPLIAIAPGTQGMGHQCAPSRVFNQGIH